MSDLHRCGQSDVTSAERRGVFIDLRLSRFLQSGEEESQCGWWVVESLSFSLSLSLSLLVGVLSSAFFWSPRCREICLLYRFSLLIVSNWVFFVLFFFRIGRKITLTYFYFLTNLIDISLCADPMRRNPFFSILKKVSAPITSGGWMLSWALVAIIILCVR